jgi:hypothetical protein
LSSLTPEQRSLRARLAAEARWAKDRDCKANARRAQKGLWAKFLREARAEFADLSEGDIEKRAEHAYKAHMLGLAFKSSRARSARAAGGAA